MAQACRQIGLCSNSPGCCMPTTGTAARRAAVCMHLGPLLQRGSREVSRLRTAGSQLKVLDHNPACHCRRRVLRCRADGADLLLLEPMHDIDPEALAAEAPGLLALCRDLDLTSQISTLRQEVQRGMPDLSLQAIHSYVDSWSHEQMVRGLEEPPTRPTTAYYGLSRPTTTDISGGEPWWNAELAMQDLRQQACRQVLDTGF